MAVVGLKTHIWANNTRSAVLMAGFPFLLLGILYAAQVVLMGYGFVPGTKTLEGDFLYAAQMLPMTAPFAFIGAGGWFVVAYFANQTIIDMATGARVVERTTQPELYNLLENLAISRGMTTPKLRYIDRPELNAFATGLHSGQFSITVTRGLVEALDRDELEAVLAHELTHIINRDVRTMVIASVFVGIISVVAELIFRSLRLLAFGGGNRRGGGNGAIVLVVVGFAIAAIGWVLALVIRMAISRRREYLADAGSVELTKNPDAMISALQKVSGRSDINAPDEVAGLFLDHHEEGFMGLFATHPPIEKRIQALVAYAGGVDQMAERQRVRAASATSVPTTD